MAGGEVVSVLNPVILQDDQVVLTAREVAKQMLIPDSALANTRIDILKTELRHLMVAVRTLLYEEKLLTDDVEVEVPITFDSWGHTGKLVAWYAPWFGRRWEKTTHKLTKTVKVSADYFAAYPELPVRPESWGEPVRVVTPRSRWT